MPVATCCVCRDIIAGGERFVLVRQGREEVHCSQSCLVANVQARQRARAAVRRRWLLRAAAVALVVIGAPKLWHRFRLPQAQSISLVAEDVRPAPRARPAPVFEGPAWPPTDDDWLFAFHNTVWSYPLPGPVRRPPAVADGHSVDVPAELWGEHVYAVHEGTVDHLQHAGGEVSLRLVHFGGMVFTHYAHLAAVPRTIKRGAQVKAGDVIGSVGDTGHRTPRPLRPVRAVDPPVQRAAGGLLGSDAADGQLAAAAPDPRHGGRVRPDGERPADAGRPTPPALTRAGAQASISLSTMAESAARRVPPRPSANGSAAAMPRRVVQSSMAPARVPKTAPTAGRTSTRAGGSAIPSDSSRSKGKRPQLHTTSSSRANADQRARNDSQLSPSASRSRGMRM